MPQEAFYFEFNTVSVVCTISFYTGFVYNAMVNVTNGI